MSESYRFTVISLCLKEFKCNDNEADNTSKIVMNAFFQTTDIVNLENVLRSLTCNEYLNYKGEELRAELMKQCIKGFGLPEGDADDIVQNVMEKFITKVGEGYPIKVHPLALLRIMTRNRLINDYNKKKNEREKANPKLVMTPTSAGTKATIPLEDEFASEENVEESYEKKQIINSIKAVLGEEKGRNLKTYAAVRMYYFGFEKETINELRQILKFDSDEKKSIAEKMVNTFFARIENNENLDMIFKEIGQIMGISTQAVQQKVDAFKARARLQLRPMVEG